MTLKNYSFRADEELTQEIESYIDDKKLSLASLFKVATHTYIQQQRAMDELPSKAKETIDMIKQLEKILSNEKNQYGLDEIKKSK